MVHCSTSHVACTGTPDAMATRRYFPTVGNHGLALLQRAPAPNVSETQVVNSLRHWKNRRRRSGTQVQRIGSVCHREESRTGLSNFIEELVLSRVPPTTYVFVLCSVLWSSVELVLCPFRVYCVLSCLFVSARKTDGPPSDGRMRQKERR